MSTTKPVSNGYITCDFEGHKARGQKGSFGIDIGTKDKDPVKVYAATDCTVHITGWSETFGNRVWVKIDSGEHIGNYAIYPHLIIIDAKIHQGKKLLAGDYIGIMGNTGIIMHKGKIVTNKPNAKGEFLVPMPAGRHLHYEHRTKPDTTGISLNPLEIVNLYKK